MIFQGLTANLNQNEEDRPPNYLYLFGSLKPDSGQNQIFYVFTSLTCSVHALPSNTCLWYSGYFFKPCLGSTFLMTQYVPVHFRVVTQ